MILQGDWRSCCHKRISFATLTTGILYVLTRQLHKRCWVDGWEHTRLALMGGRERGDRALLAIAGERGQGALGHGGREGQGVCDGGCLERGCKEFTMNVQLLRDS